MSANGSQELDYIHVLIPVLVIYYLQLLQLTSLRPPQIFFMIVKYIDEVVFDTKDVRG